MLARSAAPRGACQLRRLLLLVWAGAVRAQRPGCAPLSASNPCLLECPGPPGGDLDILRFDLSAFLPKGGAQFLQMADSGGKGYYMMPCQPLTAVSCGGSSSTAAIQNWAGTPPTFDENDCAVLGQYPAGMNNCTLMDTPAGGASSLLCSFSGGSQIGQSQRVVQIKYLCAKNTVAPTATQPGGDQDPLYIITLSGPAACSYVWTRPLSWGSLFLIFFFVGLIVYIVAGMTYNVKVRKKKLSTEAVPQLYYWKQVPGLVKDGCKFSYVTSRKAFYSKVLGKAPPLDSDLTRRLADGVDPADDRT